MGLLLLPVRTQHFASLVPSAYDSPPAPHEREPSPQAMSQLYSARSPNAGRNRVIGSRNVEDIITTRHRPQRSEHAQELPFRPHARHDYPLIHSR